MISNGTGRGDDDGTDTDVEILSNNPVTTTTTTNTTNTDTTRPTNTAARWLFDMLGKQIGDEEETVDEGEEEQEQEQEESDSDSDIEIQAGDKWIDSNSFLKNKDMFKQDIKQKKKEELMKVIGNDKNNNDEDDDDDKEFVVLNANKKSKNEICPLTLTKIKQGIKNWRCPHYYEKQAIKNYKQYLLKNNTPKDKWKCPQGGCNAQLVIFC